MNKRRLLKLATFLATVPRRSFNMLGWQTRDPSSDEGPLPGDCGFAGCAMGWAAHARLFRGLFIKGFGVDLVYCPPGTRHYKRGYDAAAEVFGILWSEAHELFSPSCYAGADPTPKQVARRIRKFVETGRIV